VGWLLGQLIRYFLRSKLAKFAQHVNETQKEQMRANQQNARNKEGVHVDFYSKRASAKALQRLLKAASM